jgi:hypothetical protein
MLLDYTKINVIEITPEFYSYKYKSNFIRILKNLEEQNKNKSIFNSQVPEYTSNLYRFQEPPQFAPYVQYIPPSLIAYLGPQKTPVTG